MVSSSRTTKTEVNRTSAGPNLSCGARKSSQTVVMKKTLSAVCVVLTIALAFGIIAQAAPLLPDQDEIINLLLSGADETQVADEEYSVPVMCPAEPDSPADGEAPVAEAQQGSAIQTPEPEQGQNNLKIAFNGVVIKSVVPILIDGVTYVPFRAFCLETVPGAQITWDPAKNLAYCKAPSLEIEVPYGETYIIANGRVIFRHDPNISIDNKMYVPVRSLAKAIGANVEWRASEMCVNLELTGKPITPASQFYNQNDLLWLARIINAESKYEPLLGKIAVGDVILNRVAHPDFPNSIYEVIFDNRYAVQFYPVTSPIIYNTPSEESIIAAKACLEGFSVSKSILYFMNPRLAKSNWIVRNCTYVMTIGNHDFYA